jgi:hypothetical protein
MDLLFGLGLAIWTCNLNGLLIAVWAWAWAWFSFFFLELLFGGLLVAVWYYWIGLVVQQFWCTHYSLLGSIISDFSFFIMSSNESFGICFTEKIVLLGNSSLNCLLWEKSCGAILTVVIQLLWRLRIWLNGWLRMHV